MKNNDWALRVTLQADDNMSRYEFTIPMIEVDGFINMMQRSLVELKTVQEKLGNE
jgi:hypothetical protein